MFHKGFTLFEIIIVIAILAILAAIVIPDFNLIKKQSDLDNSAQEFATVLKLAQSRTLASEDNKQYGVYINNSSPGQYILFKGVSFAARDTSADQVYNLAGTVEFYSVSLNEIVFDRITGASEESGSVSFRIKLDPAQNKTIYISNSGTIGFSAPVTPPDSNRVKDWRHVHINYSRTIDTSSESLKLDFGNSSATATIPIGSNLVSSQLSWTGTVNVNGSGNQTVTVRTHFLNDLTKGGTQFSVHRDARYNNTILKITLSGDNSGYLLNYSADGSNVDSTSIYASNLQRQ